MIQDIGVLALQVAELSDRIQVRKIEGITLGPVAGVPLHTQAGNFLFGRARLQFIYHSGKVAVILRNGKHGIADAPGRRYHHNDKHQSPLNQPQPFGIGFALCHQPLEVQREKAHANPINNQHGRPDCQFSLVQAVSHDRHGDNAKKCACNVFSLCFLIQHRASFFVESIFLSLSFYQIFVHHVNIA